MPAQKRASQRVPCENLLDRYILDPYHILAEITASLTPKTPASLEGQCLNNPVQLRTENRAVLERRVDRRVRENAR